MAIRYLSGINVDSNTLFVDSTNNRVGIGTGSPGYRLQVNGDAAFFSAAGSLNSIITQGSEGKGRLYLYDGGNATIALQTNGASYFNAGNVGIGTTSPDYKLSVNESTTNPIAYFGLGPSNASSRNSLIVLQSGTIPQNGSDTTGEVGFLFKHSYGTGGVNGTANGGYIESIRESVFGITSQVNTALIFGTSAANTDNERMRINSAGNVGIGNSSPQANGASAVLDVGNGSGGTLNLRDTNTGIAAEGFNQIFGGDNRMYLYAGASGASSYMQFYTNDVERMRIHTNGNFGVGTTNPIQPLTVSAIANANTIALLGRAADNATRIDFYNNGGDSRLYTVASGNGAVEHYADANIPMVFSTNAAERMRITAAGNVGIGTTSPSAKLSIEGGADLFSITRSTVRTYMHQIGSSGEYIIRDITGNADRITLSSTGAARLNAYGSGSITGTVAYNLAVDSSGNIIETAGGVVDGSGTANYVSKWSDANTLTDSQLFDNGTNVGIGTTAPAAKLDVAGDIRLGGTATYNSVSVYNNGASGGGGYLAYQNGVVQAFFGAAGWYTGTTDTGVVIGTDSSSRPIRFYTNTERMRITGDGNVGIGTTSPGAKLDVSGTGRFSQDTTDYTLVVSNGHASSDQNYISLRAGATQIGAINRPVGTNDIFLFSYYGNLTFGANTGGNATERMRIDSTGNVGIGTTSPTDKLQVVASTYNGITITTPDVATLKMRSSGGGTTNWGFATTNLAASDFGIYESNSAGGDPINAGTARLYFKTGGNVGIGNTNPSVALDVTGEIAIRGGESADDARMYFRASDNSNRFTIETDFDGTTSNDLLGFTSAGTDNILVLKGNGNVGIGTTSPATLLHVSNASSVIGRFSNTATSVNTEIGVSGGLGYVGTQSVNAFGIITSDTERMRITGDGNVGIGTTSPDSKLQVTSTGSNIFRMVRSQNNFGFEATGTSSGGYGLYDYQASSYDIYFKAGNVGIGTTSPSFKLDVNGNTRIGGNSGSNTARLNVGGAANEWVADFQASTTTNQSYGLVVRAGTSSTDFPFYVLDSSSSTAFFAIKGNGNVGIGTTSPISKLHVDGSSYFNGNMGINGEGSGVTVDTGYGNNGRVGFMKYGGLEGMLVAGSSTLLRLGHRTDSTVVAGGTPTIREDLVITAAGNVGIGTTSPTEKLHVDGNAVLTYNNSYQGINSVGNKAILARVSPTTGIVNYAEYATATNLNGFVMGSDDARVKGNIATDSLEFITNGSTRMTVLSSGYVGVNTTTPGTNFHVIGDVLIQTGALGVGVNPNATDGRIDASNDIVAFSTSDRRLKENITPIANALEKVRSLTGVEFDWKEETKSVHGYEGHDVGVIAQDVQAVLPEAVRTNDSGYLSVRYEKMIALLVEAMKEQQAQIDELKAQINDSPR